jgi:hypothetical protein
MDQEIYNKYKSPDIVTVIKVRILKWLEHVPRMASEGTLQKILQGKRGESEDFD